MALALIIRLLLSVGLAETTAIRIAQSKRIRRAVTAGACVALLALGGWYLTHVGGEWREAAIRAEWDAKFRAIERDSEQLASDRAALERDIADRVRTAIESLPVVLPPLPPEMPLPAAVVPAVPVQSRDCSLPASAAAKLNQIRK